MDIHAIFQARLPRRPYCSNDLSDGLVIRPAVTALQHRHLQPNAPLETAWLIFDLDNPGAASAWEKANLPPPTLSVSNPENGHAHLFYGLATPVGLSDAARDAPIRYAAAVQAAFLEKLCADTGYAGLIAKNPFHDAWRALWVQHLYDLGELAEYVELHKRRVLHEALGLGRNCMLFDELRAWAYQWVREYKRNDANADLWHRAVLGQAEKLNVFAVPLLFNEVKAVAKSIAKWTWRNFSDVGFSAIQSSRGKRGGRPATTTLHGEPWVEQGISRATYYRHLKGGMLLSDPIMADIETKAISDNSTQPPKAVGEEQTSSGTLMRDTRQDPKQDSRSKKVDSPVPSRSRQTKTQPGETKVMRNTALAEAKAWAYWEDCNPDTRDYWQAEWQSRRALSTDCLRSVFPWYWPPLMLEEPDVMTTDGQIPFIEHTMCCLEANLRATGRRVPWTTVAIDERGA